MSRTLRILIPIAVGILVLALWEAAVDIWQVPQFVLPAPSAIWIAFTANFASLMASLWTTLSITLAAFALAVTGGVALAVLFSQSKLIETALYPYAVVLQVTPVVAIAPLILIWVGFEHINVALLILAWIVAFFPILSNTTLGLRSADHNLIDLFRLYGASRWQILTKLQLPTALPYLLGAMKVSGGLALIGTVVAEFVAGSGTATGLAWRIVEAGNRLQIAQDVRGAGALVGARHRHLLRAVGAGMGAAEQMARKRGQEGGLGLPRLHRRTFLHQAHGHETDDRGTRPVPGRRQRVLGHGQQPFDHELRRAAEDRDRQARRSVATAPERIEAGSCSVMVMMTGMADSAARITITASAP